MHGKGWCALAAAALFGLLMPLTARADDSKSGSDGSNPPGSKPSVAVSKATALPDEGKLEAFKGKKLEVKEKGEAGFKLAFPAKEDLFVRVKGDKPTDIRLLVLDSAGKIVAKDESPGPDCLVTFSLKESKQLTLVIRNSGPGANTANVTAGTGKPH